MYHRSRTLGFGKEWTKALYVVVFMMFADRASGQCELSKLIASDASTEDRCEPVAIDGEFAILGCPLDDTPAFNAGSIYVFRRQPQAPFWTQLVKRLASDGQAGDVLGGRVSIDGDTVVAGAYIHDGAKGAAYVFQRNSGGIDNWGQVKKLKPSDLAGGDKFGLGVSVSGDTAAVGAHPQSSATGAVYIFERNEGGADNWGQVKKLTPSMAGTNFGWAVAIDGDTLIVGAMLDDEMGTDAGAAYVYERNLGGANNWGLRKKLTKSSPAPNDWFGHTLALDGDVAAIGAIKIYASPGSPGEVCVFERNLGGNDNWGQRVCRTGWDAVGHDEFGRGIGLSGDTLVVGASLDNQPDDGRAYIFQRHQGGTDNWGGVRKITPSDLAWDDRFGHSVALSGETAIIASYLDDNAAGTDAGAAYIFHAGTGCPIPTLSEWGMVAMAGLMLLAGAVVMSKRRRAA